MILGFKRRWGKEMGDLAGKLTLFPEKIWTGAALEYVDEIDSIEGAYYSHFNDQSGQYMPMPKIHTIRSGDRWSKFFEKHGEKAMINFYVDVRKSTMFNIAPDMVVKSVQKIRIQYFTSNIGPISEVYIDGEIQGRCMINGLDKMPSNHSLNKLSQNDGFDNAEYFFRWFNSDFNGEIIHWTPFKY